MLKLCKKSVAHVHLYDDGNSVSREKTNICNAKLGDLGLLDQNPQEGHR